jgi:hypothetical protein
MKKLNVWMLIRERELRRVDFRTVFTVSFHFE